MPLRYFKRRGIFYFTATVPFRIPRKYHDIRPFRNPIEEGTRIKRRKSVTSILAQRALDTISNESLPAISFRKAVTEFLRHCAIKGLAPDTVKLYDKELKQLGRSFADIGAPLTDVRQVRNTHIEGFIEHQQGLGRAINTINTRLRAGRTFFNFCIRKEYATINPFDTIEQLKKRHEVGATFTKRQLKKLLEAPDITTFVGLRDYAIMLTLAHTGVRLSELVHLRVQDVSFDGKGAINVQHAKNRYARRIPLTARLKQVLRAYIQERGVMDIDALFVTVDNTAVNQRLVQRHLKDYGEKTGVLKEVAVNPHAFRRTFCRLKVEAGTNIFVLQRLTGHQSLEILKRYVEIYGRDLEKAIEQGFEGM